MRVSYKSYVKSVITADVLTRELVLTPKEAVELLVKISGYGDHSTMPIGHTNNGPAFSRAELIARLIALRPEIFLERADAMITKLGIHEQTTKRAGQLPRDMYPLPSAGNHETPTRSFARTTQPLLVDCCGDDRIRRPRLSQYWREGGRRGLSRQSV
jgi:hypothetical protein